MSEKRDMKDSKTMNYTPEVSIEYICDESSLSSKRSQEVADLIFQMIILSRKRGRPVRVTAKEMKDAA